MECRRDLNGQLEEVFSEVLGISPITDEMSQDNVPQWDSLRHIQLILAIERVTGKVITPIKATEMSSVRKIREVLEET